MSPIETRLGNQLTDPMRATRVLQDASTDSGWQVREVRSVDVVSERPEERTVFRFRVLAKKGGNESEVCWYGTQYRNGDGERMLPALRFLRAAAAPEIRVPVPIGYSREARLMITTAVEGRPLAGALEDPIESRVAASLKRFGRALASFHAIRSPGPSARSADRPEFGRWDAAAETAALDDTERALASSGLEPRIAEKLREGCAALRGDLAQEGGVSRAPSVIHRQLHPGHVIFGPDGIGLVDLDEASFGEPEQDLGMLIAHMHLSDLKRGAPVRLAPARANALKAGYMAGGILRPTRLATYTSSALLGLASSGRTKNGGVGAPDWPRLTAVMIEEALPEVVKL